MESPPDTSGPAPRRHNPATAKRLGSTASTRRAGTIELGTMLAIAIGAIAAGGAAILLVNSSISMGERGEHAALSTPDRGQLEFVQVQAVKSADGFTTLKELATLAAGQKAADLRTVELHLRLGEKEATFHYAAEPGEGAYTATAVRDADGSFSAGEPILTRGDLIEITINLGAGLELKDRATMVQDQVGLEGASATTTLKVPGAINSGTIVPLDLSR